MNKEHFPFLPEDAWKKKAVEESRRAIIARIEHEKRSRINSLLLEYDNRTKMPGELRGVHQGTGTDSNE